MEAARPRVPSELKENLILTLTKSDSTTARGPDNAHKEDGA
jgi:hypothetical protein